MGACKASNDSNAEESLLQNVFWDGTVFAIFILHQPAATCDAVDSVPTVKTLSAKMGAVKQDDEELGEAPENVKAHQDVKSKSDGQQNQHEDDPDKGGAAPQGGGDDDDGRLANAASLLQQKYRWVRSDRTFEAMLY